uniref:Uncharacterized protein LOC114342681 n=1 Tax=Diabrotica virgifera virgifera TaxID=50390 RepID=A0A6P7GHG4_DIAVI
MLAQPQAISTPAASAPAPTVPESLGAPPSAFQNIRGSKMNPISSYLKKKVEERLDRDADEPPRKRINMSKTSSTSELVETHAEASSMSVSVIDVEVANYNDESTYKNDIGCFINQTVDSLTKYQLQCLYRFNVKTTCHLTGMFGATGHYSHTPESQGKKEVELLKDLKKAVEQFAPIMDIADTQINIILFEGELDLWRNHWKNEKERNAKLPDEVPKVFDELTYLECRGCALTTLNNEIYHLLPDLIHLDLGKNEIKNISQNDFQNLQSLRHLKLDSNMLYSIDISTFSSQAALRKLSLSNNKIKKISPGSFSENHNLTELDVSYNRVDDMSFLEPLYDILEKLDLSGNHLRTELLTALINLNSLKELKLADCGLAQINAEVIPKSVSVLDLSENYLSSLNKNILPPNLTTLDISGNRFRGLEEDILLYLDNTQNIKLGHNLWSCDLCHIVPMLERTNKSAVFRDVTCSAPYIFKGKKLEKIQRNELTWCSSASYTASDANFFSLGEDGKVGIIAASTSVFLLLLTAFAIIGALCYANRHAARYYTHEDKIATIEGESIFASNHSPLFCDGELNFKFPLDMEEKKISIATIDEIKKEHAITNGT